MQKLAKNHHLTIIVICFIALCIIPQNWRQISQILKELEQSSFPSDLAQAYQRKVPWNAQKWQNIDNLDSNLLYGAHFTNMDKLLIPAWVSNHMHSKVWNEITYPFLNFNGCTVEVLEWISDFILHFIMDVITYPYWD